MRAGHCSTGRPVVCRSSSLVCGVLAVRKDLHLGQPVRFLDLHRRGQVAGEHRQLFRPQLVDKRLRQGGARLELVDDDALDHQVGIVVGADLGHVLHQRVQRLAGEFVAVEGNQAGVGGDQRRAGIEMQRRRRVDPDLIEAFERIERLAQLVDLVARFEFGLELFQRGIGRQYAQVFEGCGGARALVMELVEGPTLAERLESGAFSIAESLSTALQIAQALEEAHDKGIVHRDLKPQNVKASSEGKTKVLDFGLAKAMDSSGASSSAADLARSPTLVNSPTLTAAHGTQLGVILGTAAYMAPEQAAGGAVDRRADIWSFGVVLYEMLTGRRLFDGETVSHVLAGVLKDTPDFAALPAATPPRIVELVQRCLRKKPRERLQSIGDARLALEEALADPRLGELPAAGAPAVAASSTPRSPLPWILAAAGLAAAALFAVLWLRVGQTGSAGRVVQAALIAPGGTSFTDYFALSPDGRRVVFEAFDREIGARALWVRALDRGEATKLESTTGGDTPFWSPDGAQIAFFADGKLKRLDLRGGPAQTICDAPTPRGGAWGPDGRIVFSPAFRSGLSIVAATGGAPQPLTTLDGTRDEKSHRFPVFLPGGKQILFLAQTAEGGARNDASTIEVLDLASGQRTPILGANSSPLYSAAGQLLFWREGTLFAQAFDAAALKLRGEPAAIASPVAFTGNEQVLASISNEGTLLYRAGARGSFSSLVWLDRAGSGLIQSP